MRAVMECGVVEEVRVLIADDHAPVREGVRAMLAGEPYITVVGEAINGLEAPELAARLRPDLVLMDVRMPVMDGIEVTRRIKRECPEISVVILTTHDDPEYLLDSVRAGAAGFFLKETDASSLVETLLRVLENEPVLEPRLTSRLLARLDRGAR